MVRSLCPPTDPTPTPSVSASADDRGSDSRHHRKTERGQIHVVQPDSWDKNSDRRRCAGSIITGTMPMRTTETGPRLVDTGGLEPSASEGMLALIKRQSELAIEEAEILILLMDGRTGLMPQGP